MEKEGHYIAVGAFVILTTVLLVMSIMIIVSNKNEVKSQRYEILFKGSVAGLGEGGEVRYLGVRVGTVYAIDLVPDSPKLVSVLIDIRQTVPIYNNSVAQLKLQGITGVAYIELFQEGVDQTPVRTPADKNKYPQIKAKDSDLAQVLQSLPLLIEDVNSLVSRANAALSANNLQHLRSTLEQLDKVAQSLPAAVDQFDRTLAELELGITEIKPGVLATLKAMQETAHNTARITQLTEKLYQRNTAQLNFAASNGLQDLGALIEESRTMVIELRRLTEKLERDPSQIIYQTQPGGIKVAQ
ncbi:MAG: MlaD family protein [Proteobacteria bacterium]|jgi:phospholipid/cholesterol/gamma-HCH transport system substrate-binding protein|nr:MlaD family protein [Pseudomonadota bacterium]